MRNTGRMGSGENKKLILSREFRIILFIVLSLCQLAINSSSGVISSGSNSIKSDLYFNNGKFGLFSMAFAFGRIIGAFIFMSLVKVVNYKSIFVVSVLVKSILLMSFRLVEEGWMLIMLRGLTGIFHMSITIFIPIWIEQFGLHRYKMQMMAIIQTTIQIGKIVGYLLILKLDDDNWRDALYFEGLFLIFVFFFILFSPSKYFSSKVIPARFLYEDDKKEKRSSKFEKVPTKPQKKNDFCNELCQVFTKPVFILGMISRSLSMGIYITFLYWINEYIQHKLDHKEMKDIVIVYTIINILGPLGGVGLRQIIKKVFGSHENKNSAYVLIPIQLIGCVFGVSIPFMDNIFSFCLMSVMFSMFVSSIFPMLQGIIISALQPELKGTGFALSNFFTYLIGGPLTFIYGLIYEFIYDIRFYFEDDAHLIALVSIMSLGSIALVLTIAMAFCRRYLFRENKRRSICTQDLELSIDIEDMLNYNDETEGYELEKKSN